MSRIKIDLKTATVEQYAAQILMILRDNAAGKRTVHYYPGSVESILQFEFAPKELGLDVRGGVLHEAGAFTTYGGDRGSADLRMHFHEAVNWLRKNGFVVRDHEQSSDQFIEVTSDGAMVEVDPRTMLFVIPRKWPYWKSEYQAGVVHLGLGKDGNESSGTAFVIGPNLFATCAHNCITDVFVFLGEDTIPATGIRQHPTADVAVFTMNPPITADLRVLPVRPDLPSAGGDVAIMGFPAVPLRRTTLNISTGTVETVSTDFRGQTEFIQVSIATAGGYSGGPLLDECGRVLGIASERTFEAVGEQSVPSRPFSQVVPAKYLLELLS